MKLSTMITSSLAALTIGAFTLAPVSAMAQGRHQHRQSQQNEWKSIAIGAGAVGLLGVLSHDKTLTFAGAAGALYAVDRYNEDRDGSDRHGRLRSEYFSRDYFVRDGVRYDRQSVRKGGKDYYQFTRHDRH